MDSITRIWPIVVSVGYVRQTQALWAYLSSAVDKAKAVSFLDPRVQPLQVENIEEYEKLMAFLHAGKRLPDLLQRKVSGRFRQLDLPMWLNHDPAAPSANVRLPILQERWTEMGNELMRLAKAARGTPDA